MPSSPPPIAQPPIQGPSSFYLTPEVAAACARDIREAGDVEVFFIGRRGPDGLVAEVESHAFGTADCVPALTSLARPGDVLIHNHPSGFLHPSDADLSIASTMGNLAVGFYIINNDASECRVVVKAQDARRKVSVAEEEVIQRLSPGGSLAGVVEGFEDRPEQRRMSLAVARALNEDGIAVIEAGTGVGKSFAYLVPAVLFALRNGERVVISTNTINLQEQLLTKDIPALRRAIGDDSVEVEIVKGRSNYVCRRKAEFARSEASGSFLEDDQKAELDQVLEWIATSETGDRGDLPFIPRQEVWERVQSESDNCLRLRCPFYEKCFFYNSRRRAARARLLIVNHSLLMSDIAVRRESNNYTMAAVLPPYSRVILDEAHHLEDAATGNLSQVVTRVGLRQAISRLSRRDRREERGAIAATRNALERHFAERFFSGDGVELYSRMQECSTALSDLRQTAETLFDGFIDGFIELAALKRPRPGEEIKSRLKPELTRTTEWEDLCLNTLALLARDIMILVTAQQELLKELEDIDDNRLRAALLNPAMEWKALLGRLQHQAMVIQRFMAEVEGMCRWVELRLSHGQQRELLARLCVAPIDVSTILRESLHDRMKSEVLTSATLSVEGKFDFFTERAGLPAPVDPRTARPVERDEDGMQIHQRDEPLPRPSEHLKLSTPFRYGEQVFFGVPRDIPDPREPDFEPALIDLVNRCVAISGGRAFILFTSAAQLKRVAAACEPTIRRLGITVLRQGDEGRDALLRRFREDETSVLFATSSFWEGVDVRGRALELLILARLPFTPPTEPVQEAQFEALQARGIDPFDNLVVPRAVIRFKQGFGRLIRSRTDRGAVIVADRRVSSMGYGRRFLRSLPGVAPRELPTQTLLQQMELFFANGAAARAATNQPPGVSH